MSKVSYTNAQQDYKLIIEEINLVKVFGKIISFNGITNLVDNDGQERVVASLSGFKMFGRCHKITPNIVCMIPPPASLGDGDCGFGEEFAVWRLKRTDQVQTIHMNSVFIESLLERGISLSANGNWDGSTWKGRVCIKWTETVLGQNVVLIDHCEHVALEAKISFDVGIASVDLYIEEGEKLCVRVKALGMSIGECAKI